MKKDLTRASVEGKVAVWAQWVLNTKKSAQDILPEAKNLKKNKPPLFMQLLFL